MFVELLPWAQCLETETESEPGFLPRGSLRMAGKKAHATMRKPMQPAAKMKVNVTCVGISAAFFSQKSY